MEAVAFIGLGTMGTPMCRNIMKGGHPLYVYNRSQDKSALLVQEGARRLESPADAFTKAKIVITMLSNDSALEEVTCGPHGLLESIQPGSIHVSMSTVSPAVSTKLHALHEKKGAHFLAAPVFGRPEAAIHARLYIALSGNSAAKKEALPILQLLGQRVEDFGEAIESAAIMKLAGNFMVLSAIETLGEAMQLAAKSGVANEQFINFFTETIFASPIYKTYGKLIASEGPRPVGLTMKLALKDITLANEAAASHALPMPFGELLKKLMQTRVEAGQGDLDWSTLGVH